MRVAKRTEQLKVATEKWSEIYKWDDWGTRWNGGLIIGTDTFLEIIVDPERDGSYTVQISWPYRTEWDEMESAEVDVGNYKTADVAVQKGFDLSAEIASAEEPKYIFDKYRRYRR
jgi:hypothetical protein